jgi:uncharacterized protein
MSYWKREPRRNVRIFRGIVEIPFRLLEEIHLTETQARSGNYTTLKFLVDGMLGSLATKLRILGFDTAYDKISTDKELILKAFEEERILVTSDEELYLHAKQHRSQAILVKGTSEVRRLSDLLQKAGVESLDLSKMSRCSACNSLLEDTGRKDELGRSVFKCENCGKLYWRGSHWRKLDALFSTVNRSLASNSTKSVK